MNNHYYDNNARRVDRRFERYDDRDDQRRDEKPEQREEDDRPSERRDERYDDRRYQHEDYDRYPMMPPPVSPEVRALRAEVARLSRELDDMRRKLADQAADIREEKSARADIIAKTENISATIDEKQIETITDSIGEIDGKLNGIDANINSNIKNVKRELSDSMDEHYEGIIDKLRSLSSKTKENNNEELISEIDKIQGAVADKITEKFGTRNIGDVLKKVNSLQTLVMANMIGTVLTLVIVCYLILSLS